MHWNSWNQITLIMIYTFKPEATHVDQVSVYNGYIGILYSHFISDTFILVYFSVAVATLDVQMLSSNACLLHYVMLM